MIAIECNNWSIIQLILMLMKSIIGISIYIMAVYLNITLPGYGQTIYFQSNAEVGNLSEWNGDGGGGATYFGYGCGGYCASPFSLNIPGAIEVQTKIRHSGKYAIRCHLEDPAYANDVKLLRWRINVSEAYYSLWIYFDKNFRSTKGINVIQWKFAPDKCVNSDPLLIVECVKLKDMRQFRLYHWPVGMGYIKGSRAMYHQINPIEILYNTWIFFEAYFKQHPQDGKIIIWQDGKEIFNISGLNTATTKLGSCFYSAFGIGVYSAPDDYKDQTVYFDDIMVTDSKLVNPMKQLKRTTFP